MTNLFRKTVFLFLLLASALWSEPRQLKLSDVREITAELLIYHVENRNFTPKILRRSFKIYIESFDFDKIYLTEAEVIAYTEMSDAKAKEVINRIAHNDLSDYVGLNEVCQKAALRARPLRSQIVERISSKKPTIHESSIKVVSYSNYARSADELSSRWTTHFNKLLKIEMIHEEIGSLHGADLQKALLLAERKANRHEAKYIFKDNAGKNFSKEDRENDLATHILKSIARSLDSHTSIFSPDEARSMRASLQKQFKGIGVVMREGLHGAYIADLIPQGPAAKSEKIERGDIIMKINGAPVSDLPFEEVLLKLQRAKESRVKLEMYRPSTKSSYQVSLKQEKIVLNDDRLSYKTEPYADGVIATITLNSFYDDGRGISADQDLTKALAEISKKGPIYGMVLDMRENSGGFLTQAVKVSGHFIDKGIIVISKYSNGEMQYSRDLASRKVYKGPLVVLTSKGSASAAEVVALALQDYGVGLIVGDKRTYGKGSMQYQNITDADADIYYKVTVGRYYTISGRSTQLDGVIADIHVPTIYAPFLIGEQYLDNPISKDNLGFSFLDGDHPLKNDKNNAFNNYFPKQERKWINMLPVLKQNSAHRLANSSTYQEFLKNMDSYTSIGQIPPAIHQNDMPLSEAQKIVRDMHMLSRQKAN